jgi:hypothetical protein
MGERLAIVGSTKFIEPLALEIAESVIDLLIVRTEPDVIISGGAEGIDTLARQVASSFAYTISAGTFVEHLPAHRRWEPEGFKDRNQRIVDDCTVLLAIRCHAPKTYGSGWTADQAERQGKRVIRVIL